MSLSKGSVKLKNQDYSNLKKQQLSRGVQFVDDEFRPDLMHLDVVDTTVSPLVFKRPTELVDLPCLCHKDSYFSLKKGFIQNINILLAFSCLKFNQKLWSKVITDFKSQDWDANHISEHAGIFKFQFWQDGMSIEVVIDDLLPCQNGTCISLSSSSASEFWPALLEKAYAKLLGGYDKLEYVRLEEIIMDLTGGISECISFQNLPAAPAMKKVEFFEKIEQTFNQGTLIVFCTNSGAAEKTLNSQSPQTNSQETTSELLGSPCVSNNIPDSETGLCSNYGYLLTRVAVVPKDLGVLGALKDLFRRAGDCPIRARLFRLRCPLTVMEGGLGLGEWKGPYSIHSSEWEEISLEAKHRLRLSFDSEAEFWIPFESLLEHMAGVIICHIPDTSLLSLTGPTWQLNEHHGAWHGHQTGGSLEFRSTFLNNPQYYFDITSDSEEEVLIALVRKSDRDPLTMAIEPQLNTLAMGIGLFQVENNRPVRVHNLAFCRTIHVEPARPYRASFMRARLNTGRYVVIPFLSDPLSIAAYLLRLYLPKRTESKEYTIDVPQNSFVNFFVGPPKEAVRLQILNAANLLWPDGKNPPSPYCIITSDDGSAKTCVCKSNNNPVWNECFIFYRRRPSKVPIVIEIMDKRTIGFDVFLGRHCFKDAEIAQRSQQEVLLFGKDTKAERFQRMKGTLFVEFYSVLEDEFLHI